MVLLIIFLSRLQLHLQKSYRSYVSLGANASITITQIIVERILLLPGYNYNYINYSYATGVTAMVCHL